MTPATTEPITREMLDQFLAQLTDEQRRYALSKLLPPVMKTAPGTLMVYDEDNQWVGDIVPYHKPPPGTRVSMTDEERAELAKIPRKTRAEWDAERARAKETNSAEQAR